MKDARPKILIIGPTPPPYHGVAMMTEHLLRGGIGGPIRMLHVDLADRRGIQFVDKPDLHDVFLFIKQFFRTVLLLLKERPALFYLPISQTRIGFLRDSFLILPALIARIPVIVHLHGAHLETLYSEVGPIWKAYMGMILTRVSRFIVLGEMLRPIFTRWATPDRIAVVPNGVPWDAARHRLDSLGGSLGSSGRPFRVVFLSSLSKQKGLFVLLQAVPLVLEAHADVEFLIAGPWWGEATRKEAEGIIAAHGVTGKVRFIGSVTGQQKSDFLHSGDIFVFPGIQQEGQPITVLEAMSEGLPVIATDRGCLRETVMDGITGFVIPPHLPEAIAEKIIQLIRHPALREEMAANALKRVEQCYTTEQFVFRLQEVFRQTLVSKAGRNARGLQVRYKR